MAGLLSALLAAVGAAAVVAARDLVVLGAGLAVLGLARALGARGARVRTAVPAGLALIAMTVLGLLAGTTEVEALAGARGHGSLAAALALALGLAALLVGAGADAAGLAGLVALAGAAARLLGPAPAAAPGSLLPAAWPAGIAAALGLLGLVAGGLVAWRARTLREVLGPLATIQGAVLLLALAAPGPDGRRATVLLLAVAVPALAAGSLAAHAGPGAGRRPLAAATAVALGTLAGVPPLGTFPAKAVALGALAGAGFPVLAGLAALLATLPALAALRVAGDALLGREEGEKPARPGEEAARLREASARPRILAVALAAFALVAGAAAGPLSEALF